MHADYQKPHRIPVMTGADAAAWDAFSIEQQGVESRLLMGWAGYSVFTDLMQKKYFEKASRIVVLAGSGNNGGDGYVIAWHILQTTMKPVDIYQLKEPKTQDARYFQGLCKKYSEDENAKSKVTFFELDKLLDSSLSGDSSTSKKIIKRFAKKNIIIDAVFGTGFSGKLSEDLQKFFSAANKTRAKKISIDIASGLYADGSRVSHEPFKADVTYTFGSYKIAHLVEPGILYSGRVKVMPIGFYRKTHENHRLLKPRKIPALRTKNSHKYSSGELFLLAGDEGMEGAAIMTAQSFLALGGGLVKIFSSSSAIKNILHTMPEVMISGPVKDPDKKNIDIAGSFFEAIQSRASKTSRAMVAVIGPGLGSTGLSETFYESILKIENLILIIDGSALGELNRYKSLFENHRLAHLILTPHSGEALSLLSEAEKPAQPVANVVEAARKISITYRANVYLKGPGGFIKLHDKARYDEIYVNSLASQLATGGTGDILCGVIAASVHGFMKSHENYTPGKESNKSLLYAIEAAIHTYLKYAHRVIEKNTGGSEPETDFMLPHELIASLREASQ